MKKLTSKAVSALLLIFILSVCPIALRADVTGSISGVVHDSTGAVVGGARVVIENAQTNFIRKWFRARTVPTAC
jgi:hypothetical protein